MQWEEEADRWNKKFKKLVLLVVADLLYVGPSYMLGQGLNPVTVLVFW